MEIKGEICKKRERDNLKEGREIIEVRNRK